MTIDHGALAELLGEWLPRQRWFGGKARTLRAARLLVASRELGSTHYAEHSEKPFFGELVDFITSGPVVVVRLEGEGAVDVWRTMVGPTDPATAPPGTIRGDFGLVITENLVHGSDSPESAERELKLFFG